MPITHLGIPSYLCLVWDCFQAHVPSLGSDTPREAPFSREKTRLAAPQGSSEVGEGSADTYCHVTNDEVWRCKMQEGSCMNHCLVIIGPTRHKDVCILRLPPTNCVTSGLSLRRSESWLYYVKNEDVGKY